MKSSATVFLAAFLALAASWGGFVLAPQIQLGRSVQTVPLGSASLYPLARPGLAQQGLQVYRANGCVYCHTQQIGQEGAQADIYLAEAGTNVAATLAAITKINPEMAKPEVLSNLPRKIVEVADMNAAEPVVRELKAGGGRVEPVIVANGPDIARGWGKRRTVAQDYLQDYPVQLGTRRVGPDLANVGMRWTDPNWHYRHLYAPASALQDSKMPPYRYLFERRRMGQVASPDALQLTGEWAPPAGYEIVPKAEARALVAYLLSLRADAPLFEAPLTPPAGNTAPTNAPAPVVNPPVAAASAQ
ncbi:MAG: cbb3-type cytochrome c oxidase subunit II [Verrucomicrobiae bacterium]|nr:cbb3-type cytochrome c oxidase subunit II [Verrucomicrobiae bacterium]